MITVNKIMWNSSKEDLKGIILLSIINILVVYVMAWIRSFPNNWMYLHTYSQTVGMFGKVMKTLRVVALLEEVYHRGELWVCISIPLLFSLLLVYKWKCDQSSSCWPTFTDYLHTFPFMISSVPLESWAKVNT